MNHKDTKNTKIEKLWFSSCLRVLVVNLCC